MAKSKINLISLMNTAWNRRQEVSVQDYQEKVKNLLSHSFVDIENLFIDWCKQNGKTYNNEVFIVYQHVFIFMMLCDGDFLQGEYDAYVKYCNWAKINPLSVEDCKKVHSNLTVKEDLTRDIHFLVSLRDSIPADNYESMVQGFCYLSLLGDKSFDENEYYILRCFFEAGYDYCPSTWEQFKREWK